MFCETKIMANIIFIVLKFCCFDKTIKGSCCPVLTQPRASYKREHYGHFHSAASCLCIPSRWDVEKPWHVPAQEWKDAVVFHLRGKSLILQWKKNTWNLTIFCCATLMKIIKITEVKRFLKWAQIVIWTTWHKLCVNGREYWCTDKQYFLLFAETNILIQVMIMR